MSDPLIQDTAAQKAACAIIFDGEFQHLRTALRGLSDLQAKATELAVLLLIFELPEQQREAVAMTLLKAFVRSH